MDSFNSFSSFNTPSYNVNSWGGVTNSFNQSIGNVDRYGSFQSNLTPWYSNNVDSFGSISNGYNGIGTQFGKINNYDSYQRTNNLRTSMDFLIKKDQDYSLYGKSKKSYEPEFKMPKYEPFVPFKEPKVSFKSYEPEYKMPKYEPFIPFKEPKVSFKSLEPKYKFPKYEPIITESEPKSWFNSPAPAPFFPYTSFKKKPSFDDDFGFKFKL
jgi:hypothetical protein